VSAVVNKLSTLAVTRCCKFSLQCGQESTTLSNCELPYFCVCCMYTVKPVFFTCPLFCEFREHGKFVKITGRENLNTVNYIDSNAKIKGGQN